MSTDLVRYDLLVQEALKSVVRKVLADAAVDGLPGEHHFYISFRTEHPGVKLSQRLREKYPQDMTIVLQHQFEQLIVNDAGFEVGLSFSGIAERLRVPFEALTGFFDPSVQFGLKFETNGDEADASSGSGAEVTPLPLAKPSPPALKGSVPKIAAARSKKDAESKSAKKAAPATSADPAPVKPDEAEAGAEIVSLDAFRKKS